MSNNWFGVQKARYKTHRKLKNMKNFTRGIFRSGLPDRAKEKSTTEWETFKPFIRELYIEENRSLRVVRAKMKKRHKFEASNRQYTYKFDQWKQLEPEWEKNKKKKSKIFTDTQLQAPAAQGAENPNVNHGYNARGNSGGPSEIPDSDTTAKRQLEMTQSEILQEMHGKRLKPTSDSTTEEQNIKIDGGESRPGALNEGSRPSSHTAVQDDEQESSTASTIAETESVIEAEPPSPHESAMDLDDSPWPWEFLSRPGNSSRDLLGNPTTGPAGTPHRTPGTPLPPTTEATDAPSDAFGERAEPVCQRNEWVRWVETQEEKSQLDDSCKQFPKEFLSWKRAADLSLCSNACDIAFELYCRVLKTLEDYEAPVWMGSYARMACARSARTQDHLIIVEDMVQRQPIPTQPCAVLAADLEALLIRAQLAHTWFELGHKEDAKRYAVVIAKAREKYFNETLVESRKRLAESRKWFVDSEIRCLPMNDRSMDLLTYHYLFLNYVLEATESQKGPLRDLLNIPLKYSLKRDLQYGLLTRNPGPFELNPSGHMENECVRSCLEWCKDNLERIGATTKRKEDRIIGADLFMYLWNLWFQSMRNGSASDYPIWAVKAGQYTGISATELLAVTCTMIQNESSKPTFAGVTKLCKLTDEKLGRKFLNAFVSRSTSSPAPERNIGSDFLKEKFNIELQPHEPQCGCRICNPPLAQSYSSIGSSGYIAFASYANGISISSPLQTVPADAIPSAGMSQDLNNSELSDLNLSVSRISIASVDAAAARRRSGEILRRNSPIAHIQRSMPHPPTRTNTPGRFHRP